MRKVFQLVLLTSFFFLSFLVLNYLVFYGLSFTFSLSRTYLFYIILLIAALSYPISLLLERFFSNSLTRVIYAISAIWWGMSIYTLILLAIYVIIGFLIKIPSKIAGMVIVTVAFLVSIYAVLNATHLDIEEVNIHLTGFKNDIRAVQISDVHVGPIRNRRFVKKLADKTIDLNPEIVFITGDLFDGTSKLHKDILKAFDRLKVPILFITGNHDTYQGLNEVSEYLNATNIKLLTNEIFEFKGLQVIGVDYSLENGYLEKMLHKIEYNKERPTILMYHLPREFEAAKDAGIDLQLSGHTHDGQFFPINYLVKLMFPYIRGLYENQGAYLYVSQGTGTWGPPMRLGSRCEITLIQLKSRKKKKMKKEQN